MKFLALLPLFVLTACSTTPQSNIKSLVADPVPAVVSVSQEKEFEVTRSVRANGCSLELRRFTKLTPAFLQGYWVDAVYVGNKLLLHVQHSAAYHEQSLVIVPTPEYVVLQIDRDLDGKYEVLLVFSAKDQSLKDALFVTEDGWLRHSTTEEFLARQHVVEGNKKALNKLDGIISDSLKKANEAPKE